MELGKGPLVSVIMNCLNGEKYLREAIDSVYEQTYRRWEIVFWDNGSADRSAEVARSYDGRLRYFRGSETVPLGAARNFAVHQARGELLAFLDCDDVWFPYTLECQVELMFSGRYAATYGGFVCIDENGKELRRYIPNHRSGNVFGVLLKQFAIGVPAVMLRRSALASAGLCFDKNTSASEEYCLFMQLAVELEFGVLNEVIAKYRVHEGSLTSKTIARWAEEREYTLNLICSRYPWIRERYHSGFREAYARARFYRAWYYMYRGEKRKARKELRPVIHVDYRYLALYALAFFPPAVWNWVQKVRTNRSKFS